ncbi:MAG: LCP family protein [Synechococcaceae cyanobacterium]|nr:LCP family protein [Synechococcaceae cyanobacterium]
MPSRRNPNPASSSSTRPRRHLFRLPLPTAVELGAAVVVVAGVVLGTTLLGLVWPEPDRGSPAEAQLKPSSLADKPRRPVTVLLIGSDADRLGDPVNGAAPRGPANADALLLVRVNPDGPLQVLPLPTELAVQMPGQRRPQALGSLYRAGGAALTADAVRELVGLERPAPDRYVVMPRAALRDLVNGLGGVELSPPSTMQYQDKAQKYRIDLEAGLQRLSGAQVEQLSRFRDPKQAEVGRRASHQLVVSGLRERLAQPGQLARLPWLMRDLQGKVDSNLNPQEALSLLAAALETERPLVFTSLPLTPAKPSHGRLRQLDPQAAQPLWPQP